MNTLSPAEIGNLLESLPPGERTVVWGLVDPEDDGEVLLHVGDQAFADLVADVHQHLAVVFRIDQPPDHGAFARWQRFEQVADLGR